MLRKAYRVVELSSKPLVSSYRDNCYASRASEETVDASSEPLSYSEGGFAERAGFFQAPKKLKEGRRSGLGIPRVGFLPFLAYEIGPKNNLSSRSGERTLGRQRSALSS